MSAAAGGWQEEASFSPLPFYLITSTNILFLPTVSALLSPAVGSISFLPLRCVCCVPGARWQVSVGQSFWFIKHVIMKKKRNNVFTQSRGTERAPSGKHSCCHGNNAARMDDLSIWWSSDQNQQEGTEVNRTGTCQNHRSQLNQVNIQALKHKLNQNIESKSPNESRWLRTTMPRWTINNDLREETTPATWQGSKVI